MFYIIFLHFFILFYFIFMLYSLFVNPGIEIRDLQTVCSSPTWAFLYMELFESIFCFGEREYW